MIYEFCKLSISNEIKIEKINDLIEFKTGNGILVIPGNLNETMCIGQPACHTLIGVMAQELGRTCNVQAKRVSGQETRVRTLQ